MSTPTATPQAFADRLLAEVLEPVGPQETEAHILAVNGMRQAFPANPEPAMQDAEGRCQLSYADADTASAWLSGFIGASRDPQETYTRTLAALLARDYAAKLIRYRDWMPIAVYNELENDWLQAALGDVLPISLDEIHRAIHRIERSIARHHRKASRSYADAAVRLVQAC